MADLSRYRARRANELVASILENPELVAAVRELPPPVLGRLIERVGLEDASELVALASTEQLAHVFDEDLWTNEQAGDDPRFDAKRFGSWLEILLEAGERVVVERLCELPFELVTLCVQRLVLVIDIEALALEMSEGGPELEPLEKALDGHLYEEWEEYRLIAREASSWDAVLSALLALDREHHDLLRRILDRCADLSAEHIDDNGGLYEVLSSDEMLEVDARTERDERRAALGYVAPSDAKSFLALARQTQDVTQRDPVTRAYFRELAAPEPALARPRSAARRSGADVNALLALLDEAAGEPAPRLRLPAGGAKAKPKVKAKSAAPLAQATERALDRALAELREQEPALYAERLEELGFLANVLIAAESHADFRLRPALALERAVAACDAGLALLLREDRERGAGELLRTTHLDQLFRRAWVAPG